MKNETVRLSIAFSVIPLAVLLLFLGAQRSAAQSTAARNAGIVSILHAVSTDTLMQRVRELCGEYTVYVKGQPTLIANRLDGFETQHNEPAGDFLEEVLRGYGLPVRSERFQERGRNVIARQEGTLYPEIKYIICAHYDAAVFQYPGADDNASGTAAVLEAARLLSEHAFDYSIEYCLWDAEERGLVGSRNYARAARQRGDSILGVINLDMIAYDSDNDLRASLDHNNESGLELVWTMQSVNNTYDVGLDLYVRLRSSTPSDNYSFTQSGYPSFLFIEDWSDFNVFYHGPKDSPDNLNAALFTGITQVAIGGLATLAGLSNQLDTTEPPVAASAMTIHTPSPHPFNAYSMLRFTMQHRQSVRIELFDIMGRNVAVLAEREFNAGAQQLMFDASAIAAGIYILRFTTDTQVAQLRVLRSN